MKKTIVKIVVSSVIAFVILAAASICKDVTLRDVQYVDRDIAISTVNGTDADYIEQLAARKVVRITELAFNIVLVCVVGLYLYYNVNHVVKTTKALRKENDIEK